MGIGICRRNKWINGTILGLLCCGMLFVEIHGTLGHSHPVFPNDGNRIGYRASSGTQLCALERYSSDPACSLCYFYRLLGYTILSHADWIIDFRSVDQTVFVYHLSIGLTSRLRLGLRSPPRV